MQGNHFDSVDRDGSIRSDRKERQRHGKSRASISSYKGKYNLNHRVRKKAASPEEQCISNLKMILQCYNVFILVRLWVILVQGSDSNANYNNVSKIFVSLTPCLLLSPNIVTPDSEIIVRLRRLSLSWFFMSLH